MNPSDIEHNLQKYAELTVKVGLNVQPGQRLLIYAPIESAPLVRPIAACAYRLGCRFVDVIWGDDGLELTRFQSAPRDSFEEFPAWLIPAVLNYAERGDAFLQISGTDPELLKDQDPALIATVQRVAAEQFTPVRNLLVRNAMNWGIVSFPIASWAAKVFPADSPADQLSRLWAAVFEVCRVTQADPVVAWQAHARDLALRTDYLNAKNYRGLKYTGPGTDLFVGLPDGHIWHGGSTKNQAGIAFIPNLPTEEVFTLPQADQTYGVVTATRPLSLNSTLIEGFSLLFEAGRVVNFTAAKGEAVLRNQLDLDEGARRLGEVALVPHRSPISQSGLVFHNTLFDENAASHLALGRAYPFTLRDGVALSDEDFAARGGNNSNIHVDFMIGSGEIDIDGLTADGAIEPVMRQGEWAFGV